MLKKTKEYSKIVLVGSNSEIGLSIINNAPIASNAEIIFVGRTKPDISVFLNKNCRTNFIYCDLADDISVSELVEKLRNISKIDLLILAAGYLPTENSEFDIKSVRRTLQINTISTLILLSALSEEMAKLGSGDILVISSVASMRARARNFTYGSSKAAIDFFTIGLANKLRKNGIFICILRPGFVFTKMTKDFKPAPFAIKTDKVGEIAVRGLKARKKVIYAPSKLKIIMNVLKLFPRFIFNYIS
jgi:decaprenylphospho-beta-D-erythro-pentofuranosid-2-ulose 2-reductase